MAAKGHHMPGSLNVQLDMLSNDGTTIAFRATVVKAPHHMPLLALKESATGTPPDYADNFSYYAGLGLYQEGDSVEVSAPAPTNGRPGEAFVWAWADATTPVSNVVTI